MAAQSPTQPMVDRLAAAVRRHREIHNLSLGELSRATGLSKTNLARLEAGGANPSLETLWRLARALGLSVGQLLEEPRPAAATVLRRGAGPVVESTAGMRGRLLHTDGGRHRTELFELDLPPDAQFRGDAHEPGTREAVYCVAGRIRCGPLDAPLELEPGDTAFFDGAAAHVYAAGPEGGRALLVMSYPA
ncbi:helix-turn-helix domain-containing protein [Pseudonocardia thermophila]|uniref:helix-turn-helix domain-containing protein n=1 Tax=Pseudonocardia thermophila TaxID=1848 RepID=UPI00248EEF43|nr:XRE family transcriptional regulator [Pseudonocardia thermophila]